VVLGEITEKFKIWMETKAPATLARNQSECYVVFKLSITGADPGFG